MSERKVLIAAAVIALGFALACGRTADPPATESGTPAATGGEVRIETPGPIVDLDPDPGKPEVFAWYWTPVPTPSGSEVKTKMGYKGSLLESMDPETNECDFREDLIGGEKIETFEVRDAENNEMSDSAKVRLRSLNRDGSVKIEIVIEKDVAGKRLNWVVDDKTDELPPCTLKPVSVYEKSFVPVEFEDLKRDLFREISGEERIATDFKFWVQYMTWVPVGSMEDR